LNSLKNFRLLKYQSYRAMPWRNGLGSTLEIAREPPTGGDFAWRLSLADIERDTDFSAYPGYSRALVLVGGDSLSLRFRGHGRCLLDATQRGTRFEGDWQTRGSVPQGRCTDLSLIVRKRPGARSPTVVRAPRVLRLKSIRRVTLAKDLYGALFVLEGSVAVTESLRARTRTVHEGETLLLSPGPARTLTLRSLGPSCELVILRWSPA
jgi:environmental stress-induced protein Ves